MGDPTAEVSCRKASRADLEFDENGKIVRKSTANDLGLKDTIVVDSAAGSAQTEAGRRSRTNGRRPARPAR